MLTKEDSNSIMIKKKILLVNIKTMKVAIARTLTFIIVPYKIISLIFKTDLNSDVIIELNNVNGM